jgi:hypothetical protein
MNKVREMTKMREYDVNRVSRAIIVMMLEVESKKNLWKKFLKIERENKRKIQ